MKLEAAITKKRPRIEMIPLIDCIFIILVFFIYSMLAMTLRRGVEVQLPAASGLRADAEDALVITVTAEGDFLIDNERISAAGLREAVRTRAARSRISPGELRVLINGDEGARHGWIMRVIDELRAEGVSEVMLLTREPREEATADERR